MTFRWTSLPRAPGDVAATRERLLARVLLIAGLLVPIAVLLPELVWPAPDVNDFAFHEGVVRSLVTAVKGGANPLDFWVPTWNCGFPLFHYYQPGPYLFAGAAYALTLGRIALPALLHGLQLLVLAAFPLSLHRAMRRLGFAPLACAWGAFLSCLIAGGGRYGIEFESFAWGGWGLFGQAVALPVLPLALAEGALAVRRGRKTLAAGALLATAMVAHVLYGYIAAISMVVVPLLVACRPPAEWLPALRARVVGLARVAAQCGALVAFFVLPLALHSTWHAKSLFDPAEKFNSHGAKQVLTWLCAGDFLDHGRLPVLTALVAAGMALAAWRWLAEGDEAHGFALGGFVLWVLLFFGPATWGALTRLLPLSHGLHFERLSSGVHVFALLLAAIAAAEGSSRLLALGRRRDLALGGALGVTLVVLPLLGDRTRYALWNAGLLVDGQRRWAAERGDLDKALEAIRREPPGRIYAGHSGNWGRNYEVGPVKVYHVLSAENLLDMSNAPFSWSIPTDFGFDFAPARKEAYDLYDVHWLLTDQADLSPPGATLAVHAGRHRLFRVPADGPFEIVSVPLALAGDKESTWYLDMSWAKGAWWPARAHARLLFQGERVQDLRTLTLVDDVHFTDSVAADPSRVTSVFDAPGAFAAAPPPPPAGTLTNETSSDQQASAVVDLPAAATVLFKSTYHPNWHAWVDGAPAATYPLTPGLLGVTVPAGHHELRVAYRPGLSKILLLLVGIAAALAIDRLPALGAPSGEAAEAPGGERG